MIHNENYFNLLLTLQSAKPLLLFKIVLNEMVDQSLQIQRTMGAMLADFIFPRRMLSLFWATHLQLTRSGVCESHGHHLLIAPPCYHNLFACLLLRRWYEKEMIRTSYKHMKEWTAAGMLPRPFHLCLQFQTVTRSPSLCSCSTTFSFWDIFLSQKGCAFLTCWLAAETNISNLHECAKLLVWLFESQFLLQQN